MDQTERALPTELPARAISLEGNSEIVSPSGDPQLKHDIMSQW
jgi:hypothetical protein